MRIEDLDDQALEAELERRKRIPPMFNHNPDFSDLTKMVTTEIERIASEGREDEDFEHYVYEAALEAICGSDIWKWLSRATR
jgi:hypothetical protein